MSNRPKEEHPSDAPPWLEKPRQNSATYWAYGLAIAFHAVLLILHLPTSSVVEAEPEQKPHIVLSNPPRYQPPEVKPEEVRKPPTHKQPIPDPRPDDPEPLMVVAEIEPELTLDPDDLFFEMPAAPPAPEITGPMEVVGGVTAPVVTSRIQPQYTENARRIRREGVVILKAVIDEDGSVTDLTVLKSLGFGLDEAALAAARQWKFTPATLRGKPVPVFWRMTVHFTLG